eukprot:jgi/Tetstr1/454237/TSEL_041156.t1
MSSPVDLDWFEAVMTLAGVAVLGACIVLGTQAMGEYRWLMRPWEAPPAQAARGMPGGVMRLGLHTLRVDADATDRLVRAVGLFPPAVRPLAVHITPAVETLVRILEQEGHPVLVVGPGRGVFRLFHRLPTHGEMPSRNRPGAPPR